MTAVPELPVSGRDQPRPVPAPHVTHVVRFAAVIADDGPGHPEDWHAVLKPKAVIQATCDGCPGWSRTADNFHTGPELDVLTQHGGQA